MNPKIPLKTFLSLGVIFGLAITIHAQNLYVSVNGPLGLSNGSISEYTPSGERTTFTSEIPQPRGLAFDSVGNLCAAISALVDDHEVGKVVKFNPRRRATAIRAIPLIERTLAIPSYQQRPTLRLDPKWDSIRSDPRFQKLCEENQL